MALSRITNPFLNVSGAVNANIASPAANTIAFTTAATERMRIDSAGNIGIGTASPAYKLDVVGTVNVPADSSYTLGAGADRYIKYRSGNGDILYSFAAGNFYQQSITSSYHAWFTGNNERMRIDSSGLVTVASGQIKFPASQNASADANTLDDYEEGTFTPVITGTTVAGTATYSSQSGSYIKIGRYVYLEMFVVFSSTHTGTGGTKVGGLPFTISGFGNGGTITYKTSWVTNGPDFMQGEATTNFGYLRYDTNTSQGDIAPNVNIQNTSGFMLIVSYLTAT